ncbi:MAG: 4-hydroxythreonine-4-phosphate dehydrogenase PdxA [Rikenellaceae bacterium]
MADRKLRIGITHGDINGISYEILIKVLSDNRMCDLCTPVVYGSNKVAGVIKREMKEFSNFSFNVINSASEASLTRPNIVNCIDDSNIKVELGKSTHLAGQYAVASLNAAMKDLNDGIIDAVVTCPINKSNVQSDDFDFVGHTEFFASNFGGKTPLMFMVSDQIRVGIVTIHDPLVKVVPRVSTESILEKLRLMKQSLVRDFAIVQPRIAVMGLNPHAGDCGLLGVEEQEIIIPAINSAKFEGIEAFGPYAADGFFAHGAYNKFDAILAMYHDQGLIPFKIIAGDESVNYTAGLSVIRTSPSHGVGYDIADKFIADPSSLRKAIYYAIDICRNRSIDDEINKDSLQTYSRDTWGKDASMHDIKSTEPDDLL